MQLQGSRSRRRVGSAAVALSQCSMIDEQPPDLTKIFDESPAGY
jgi:hypothetical protein